MRQLPTIIVPARLASTRLERKLLYPIEGKPLILWTAERIRSEAPEVPLFFAVDSEELYECLSSAGFEAIRTRESNSSGTDRIAEANAIIGADQVINVQGDEPLILGEQIRQLAESFIAGHSMATLAIRHRIHFSYVHRMICKRTCHAERNQQVCRLLVRPKVSSEEPDLTECSAPARCP